MSSAILPIPIGYKNRASWRATKWQQNNPEQANITKRKYAKTHKRIRTEEHKIISRVRSLARYHKLYAAALAAYGGKCACCGEERSVFLQLDHINNDGAEHRRRISMGTAMFAELARQNYPGGFQVLCANCHLAKTRKQICPHKR